MQTPCFTSVDHVVWSNHARAQDDHTVREAEYGSGPFQVQAVQFPFPAASGNQKVFIKVPGSITPIELDSSLLVQAHPSLSCDCALRGK